MSISRTISRNIQRKTEELQRVVKRVAVLYRVSTKKQVDKQKDDIPMQKIACHDFVEDKGWVIVKEFYEKGVSGFKVSAANRDAIVELKEYAIEREFDVLLVYMFDRLGRIDSETPFVLEWFVEHGIEVWSVQEGQQKLDDQVDKLMNYIRFWQANGESVKTSMRLKTVTAQMVSAGIYRGGAAPFGYRAEHLGRVNKKGQPVKDLIVDEREKEIVIMMAHKTLHEGYGSYILAEYLNGIGVRTHNGSKFTPTSVIRVLRNKLLCGYYVAGDTVSPKIEELAILDEHTFDALQYILNQRLKKNEEKMHIAKMTKGKTLLSGNIYCGHCGNRLSVSGGIEYYYRKDGTKVARENIKYTCYHKMRKLSDCDGQSVYVSKRIDNIVLKVVKEYLERIKTNPKDKALELRYAQEVSEKKRSIKKLNEEREKMQKRLKELSVEVGKSISGESSFSTDILTMSIQSTEEEIRKIDAKLDVCDKKLIEKNEILKNLDYYYSQFKNWAEEFDYASNERKKMIICHLIKAIRVKSGYEVDMEFNVNYSQFFSEEEKSVAI